MKKFLLIFTLIPLLWSCQKGNDDLTDVKGEALEARDFFDKIASKEIDLEKGDALLISYEWNSKDNTIRLLSSEPAERSWSVALEAAGFFDAKRSAKGGDKQTYIVSCDKGGEDGKGWSQSCNDPKSCGDLMSVCLFADQGCTTICKAKMLYLPLEKMFFLGDDSSLVN